MRLNNTNGEFKQTLDALAVFPRGSCRVVLNYLPLNTVSNQMMVGEHLIPPRSGTGSFNTPWVVVGRNSNPNPNPEPLCTTTRIVVRSLSFIFFSNSDLLAKLFRFRHKSRVPGINATGKRNDALLTIFADIEHITFQHISQRGRITTR